MKKILGFNKLKKFFLNSNLIGLVDWNNMTQFNNIFKGIIDEILPEHTPNKKQIMFFDLADFTEKSREDVLIAIEYINTFNKHYKVILSLNEIEAVLLYKALYPDLEPMDLITLGQAIYKTIKIDVLVFHTLNTSLAFDEKGVTQAPSLYVKKPTLSTGAGDNFNAGFCLGQLLSLKLDESLYIANATTGFYIRNAYSPSIQNLLKTLESWESLIEAQ